MTTPLKHTISELVYSVANNGRYSKDDSAELEARWSALEKRVEAMEARGDWVSKLETDLRGINEQREQHRKATAEVLTKNIPAPNPVHEQSLVRDSVAVCLCGHHWEEHSTSSSHPCTGADDSSGLLSCGCDAFRSHNKPPVPAPPSDRWVTLGELKPGDVFETKDGAVNRIDAHFTSVVGDLVSDWRGIGWSRLMPVRRLIVCRDDAETVNAVAQSLLNTMDIYDCTERARRILECLRGMR